MFSDLNVTQNTLFFPANSTCSIHRRWLCRCLFVSCLHAHNKAGLQVCKCFRHSLCSDEAINHTGSHTVLKITAAVLVKGLGSLPVSVHIILNNSTQRAISHSNGYQPLTSECKFCNLLHNDGSLLHSNGYQPLTSECKSRSLLHSDGYQPNLTSELKLRPSLSQSHITFVYKKEAARFFTNPPPNLHSIIRDTDK